MSPSENISISEFVNQLQTIRWFANLGKPLTQDAECRRIHDWNSWPGPEEPSVAEIHDRHQALYDELMAGERSAELKELWDRIESIVLRNAAVGVPYDSEQDTWYPPNMAVWQAIWTAGLMGLCMHLGHPVPPELRTQWEWFAQGHWPCDCDGDFPSGKPVLY